MILKTDLRAILPALGLAIAIPTIDLVMRFLIPISSALAWYFLKKLIIYLEKKYKE